MAADNQTVTTRKPPSGLSAVLPTALLFAAIVLGPTLYSISAHLLHRNEKGPIPIVTVSTAAGGEVPLGTRGLRGIPVSSDGIIVNIQSGGRLYTLHHLTEERVETLVQNEGRTIRIYQNTDGDVWIVWGAAL